MAENLGGAEPHVAQSLGDLDAARARDHPNLCQPQRQFLLDRHSHVRACGESRRIADHQQRRIQIAHDRADDHYPDENFNEAKRGGGELAPAHRVQQAQSGDRDVADAQKEDKDRADRPRQDLFHRVALALLDLARVSPVIPRANMQTL